MPVLAFKNPVRKDIAIDILAVTGTQPSQGGSEASHDQLNPFGIDTCTVKDNGGDILSNRQVVKHLSQVPSHKCRKVKLGNVDGSDPWRPKYNLGQFLLGILGFPVPKADRRVVLSPEAHCFDEHLHYPMVKFHGAVLPLQPSVHDVNGRLV